MESESPNSPPISFLLKLFLYICKHFTMCPSTSALN